MPQVHLYLAAAVCILVQLVACGQRCSDARHRPLSFTVVNKRNTTCHWVPEVQMDAGADDPLLNGGWHVRISLPKASTRGYGQVVEVMATKKFNEFTASSGELCGATATSTILSLINANQNNIENPDRMTTPVSLAGTAGVDTTPRTEDLQPLPTKATTTKKMEILFVPPTSSKPGPTTAKISTTPQNLITPASSNTYTTSKVTVPISVPTTTVEDSKSTSKTTLKTFIISGEPALASTSTTTGFPSTKKEEILLTTPSAISKISTAKITTTHAPASEVPTPKKTNIPFTTKSTISKSSSIYTTVSSKPTAAQPPTLVATTTTALASATEVQTTKKTDNIFTTPSTISKDPLPTTSGATKTITAAPTTPTPEVPTSKKPDIFIDPPKVSTHTKASHSTTAATQPKTATDHTKGSTITNAATTPSFNMVTLFTHPGVPTTHTLSVITSTTKASIPVEEVSPPTKEKGPSTGKPTSSLQPEIDGNDEDKIDDSHLGEKGNEYDETEDLDIDPRGREDDNDKKEDYAFDYSLNLDVKPE